VPSPNPPDVDASLLTGIDAVSPSDAFAVGWTIKANAPYQTLIERWDGTSWTIMPSPNLGASWTTLLDVDAVTADDAWAVGEATSAPKITTLALHWDGSTWQVVPTPATGSNEAELQAVDAIGHDDVWAVGYETRHGESAVHTLIEHWNGINWSRVSSPDPQRATWNELRGVSGTRDDLWAVGVSGRPFPHDHVLIEHWNGIAWSVVPGPRFTREWLQLDDVATSASSDAWAVGWFVDETSNEYQTVVEHWDGTHWSHIPTAGRSRVGQFAAVAAISSSPVWVVGEPLSAAVWNGSRWEHEPTPGVGFFDDVAPVPQSDVVWAVGGGRSTETLVEVRCL